MLVRNGARETIQIPRERYPVYLPTPLFPTPGIASGRPLRRGVFTNLDTLHLAGPSFKEASAEYPGAEFVGMHTNFSPEDFSRMVAKAYCAAVAALGIAPFSQSPIKSVILGNNDHIGRWVGCWEGEQVIPPWGFGSRSEPRRDCWRSGLDRRLRRGERSSPTTSRTSRRWISSPYGR